MRSWSQRKLPGFRENAEVDWHEKRNDDKKGDDNN